MPEISGIAHVELSVRDLERSVAWYTRFLDAREILRVFTPRRIGLEHLALLMPGGEGEEQGVARLREQGGRFGGANDDQTHAAIRYADPDRVALEMIARTPRPA